MQNHGSGVQEKIELSQILQWNKTGLRVNIYFGIFAWKIHKVEKDKGYNRYFVA